MPTDTLDDLLTGMKSGGGAPPAAHDDLDELLNGMKAAPKPPAEAPGLIPRVTSRIAYAGIDQPPGPSAPPVPVGTGSIGSGYRPPAPIEAPPPIQAAPPSPPPPAKEPDPRLAAISQQMANNPPPGPGAPLPEELKSDEQRRAEAPWITDPKTGERYQQTPLGLGTDPFTKMLDSTYTGTQTMGQGAAQMAQPSLREKAGGLHKIVSGGFEAATPLMVPGAIANPIGTAAVLGSAMAAQEGVTAGLEHLGLPPEYAEVAGDLTGILTGSIAHKHANFHTMETVKAELQRRWAERKAPTTLGLDNNGTGNTGTVPRETYSSGPQQTPGEPPPPTKSETVSAATPNPPDAAIPTMPETRETRAIQMQQLVQGLRDVVMHQRGDDIPATELAEWAKLAPIRPTSDKFGNTYSYRSDKISKGVIKSAAANNNLGSILGLAADRANGGPGGTGAPGKAQVIAQAGPNPPVVIVTAPDGTEVQATATTPEQMGPTLAAHEPLVPPGGRISVTNPQAVLNGRNGVPPSGYTGEGGQGESYIEEMLRRARGFRLEDSEDLGPRPDLPESEPELERKLEEQAEAFRKANPEFFRGAWDLPLKERGRADVAKAAAASKGLISRIVTGTLGRHQETAAMFSAANPQAGPVETTPDFNPMALGAMEGKNVNPVSLDALNEHIRTTGHEPIPGVGQFSGVPGEAPEKWAQRVIDGVQRELVNYQPGRTTLIITSGRDIQAVRAWAAAGFPADGSVDLDVLTQKWRTEPAQMMRLDPETGELSDVPDVKEGGIIFARHGETDANANPAIPAELKTPPPASPSMEVRTRVAGRPPVATPSQAPAAAPRPVVEPEPIGEAPKVEAAAEKPPHKFASTQIQVPEPLAGDVRAMAASIPDEQLTEDGREDDIHVTVKYGLHADEPGKLQELLKDQPPITVTMGKTSLFSNDDADVVKIDVDSPELHALNKKISDAMPHTDTHPDYHPHITIAYVKPGMGKEWSGSDVLEGQSFTVDKLTFSGKDRTQTVIPLTGKVETNARVPETEQPKTETIPPVVESPEPIGDTAPPKPEQPKGPIRRTDTQLKEAAMARAEEEGDAKSAKLFKKIKPKAMSGSQRVMLNEYLDRPPSPRVEKAKKATKVQPEPEAPAAEVAAEPPPAREVPPPMDALVSDGTGLFNRPKYQTAQTLTGTKIRFRWIIRNAPDLITSFREGYDQELQPRQMDRADAEVKVNHLMTKGEPEAYKQNWQIGEGAPVESFDKPNMVEIGHHRAESVIRSYERNGQLAQRYRPSIIEDADLYGFDPAEVEKIPQPVLLRQRLTEMEPTVRRKYLEDANARSTNAMSPAEQANVDSRNLMPIMGLLSPSESGDLLAASNRPFLDAFAKMVPPSEMGNYRDKEGNAYLPAFADRVQNAILAVAYGDPTVLERIMESKDDNVKIATNAMVQAAPDVAAVAEFAKKHNLDLGRSIAEATEMLSGLRNKKGKFATVYEDWKNQVKLEDNPDRNLLMHAIVDYGRSASRLANVLKIYAREVGAFESDLKKAEQYGDVDMWGNPITAEPPTRLDLIAQAIRTEGEEYERTAEAKAERAKSRNGGDAGQGPKISAVPPGLREDAGGLGEEARFSGRPRGWESIDGEDHATAMRFEPVELTGKDAERAVAVKTNSAGLIYGTKHDAAGLALPPSIARDVMQHATYEIDAYRNVGQQAPRGLVELRDAARKAYIEDKTLVMVNSDYAKYGFDKILRHELDHAMQQALKAKRTGGANFSYRDIFNNPLYEKAEAFLRKIDVYAKVSDRTLLDEIGVRLMQTGHHVDMGLTIDEARQLAVNYIQWLRTFYEKLSAKEIADRVFPALRKGQPDQSAERLRPAGRSGITAGDRPNPPPDTADSDADFVRRVSADTGIRFAASGPDRIKDFLDDEEGAFKGFDFSEAKAKMATRQAALAAVKAAEASPVQKDFGQRLIEWFVGERDSWVAKANQEVQKLKKMLPDPTEQQAITLMRDFKNKKGQLIEWVTDKHANMPVAKPAKFVNGKKVADEVTPEMVREYRSRLDKLKPAMRLALNPTPEMDAVNKRLDVLFEVSLLTGKKLGIIDSKITPEEYITHIFNPKDEGDIPIPLSSRVARAMGGKIGRRFAYGNKRGYDTVLDAVADGIRPRTLNAFDATTIYSDKFATRRATKLLEQLLKDSGLGIWGIKGSSKVPKDYIPFAEHSTEFRNLITYPDKNGEPTSAEQRLMVAKYVDDALRPITDPNYLSRVPFFMTAHMYQQWVKAANLSLSMFHPKALEMMAVSNMGPTDTAKAHMQDLESPAFEAMERQFVQWGGITDILHRTQEAYHNLVPGPVPTLGEVLGELPALKQLNTFAKGITHITFGVMQRKFKVWDFARQLAAWDGDHPGATPAERNKAGRSIVKQVNAVYGGLNLEILGWNKASLALSRLLVLAPDWTFSNWFNLKQAFEGGPKAIAAQAAKVIPMKKTGPNSWEGSPAGNASRLFWIRAMVGGIIATQLLSRALTGKWSKRLTQVFMGLDKDGQEIYQNLFFSGAPGDMVNILSKAHDRGVINGAARWLAGKYSPLIRAYETAHTGETYLGTKINQQGMSPIAQDARTLGYMGRDVAPVPFSLMNAYEMAYGPKADMYTPAEFLGTLIGGTPPSHVAPEGMKMTASGLKPVGEKEDLPLWRQIITGKAHGSNAGDRHSVIGEIEKLVRAGKDPSDVIQKGIKDGLINQHDASSARKRGRESAPIVTILNATMPRAIALYDKAPKEDQQKMEPFVRQKLLRARNKPWEWDDQTKRLAKQYFNIDAPTH